MAVELFEARSILAAAEARAHKAEQDLARLRVNAGKRLDEAQARADALAQECAAKDERIRELEGERGQLLHFAQWVWRSCNRPQMTEAERIGLIRYHPTLAKYVEPPDDKYRAGYGSRLVQPAAENQDHATPGGSNA